VCVSKNQCVLLGSPFFLWGAPFFSLGRASPARGAAPVGVTRGWGWWRWASSLVRRVFVPLGLACCGLGPLLCVRFPVPPCDVGLAVRGLLSCVVVPLRWWLPCVAPSLVVGFRASFASALVRVVVAVCCPRSPRVCGVWCGLSFLRALESAVSSSSSFPVLGAVSSWVAAPLLPVAAPSLASFVAPAGWGAAAVEAAAAAALASFAPHAVDVAGRLVPSSAFVEAVSGVVSGCSGADPRGLVVVVGGVPFRCLWSALGGRSSQAAEGLLAACRAARASGAPVTLWVAPGKSGRGARGYFCAITA
jgi:hypothetical protein